jgi:hypothetical protein
MFAQKEHTSAARSRIDLALLTARVKLVPFPLVLKAELFSPLVIELEKFFYSAFVRLERVVIAGDGIGNALQET